MKTSSSSANAPGTSSYENSWVRNRPRTVPLPFPSTPRSSEAEAHRRRAVPKAELLDDLRPPGVELAVPGDGVQAPVEDERLRDDPCDERRPGVPQQPTIRRAQRVH